MAAAAKRVHSAPPALAPFEVSRELAETIAVLRDWLSLAITDPNLVGLCLSTQRRIAFLELLRSHHDIDQQQDGPSPGR